MRIEYLLQIYRWIMFRVTPAHGVNNISMECIALIDLIITDVKYQGPSDTTHRVP